jgi:hypothetical protein
MCLVCSKESQMSVGWATVKLGGTHLGAGHELTKANYILSERER